MRLFVKIKDASMICVGAEQYPVKGQVADVPDILGASLISRDEYEVYVEQVKLHKDFVASDKASDKATAEQTALDEADAEVKRLEVEAEEKRLADEAAKADEEEAKRLAEEAKTAENTPAT